MQAGWFLALFLMGAHLVADPASRFQAGLEAEKQGRYEEALQSYRAASQASPAWEAPHRQIGSCLVRLRRPEEALKAFDRYLELKPGDQEVRDYRDRLAAQLASSADSPRSAHGVDGVTVFMKDNPHDYRKLRIGVEFFTATLAGFDIGWRTSKHHDFGLGFSAAAQTHQRLILFHPRYRYHNGRFLWDSFYEIGATFIDAQNYQTQYSAFGANTGIGVERVSAWPFHWFWMLNLGFLSLDVRGAPTFGGETSRTIPYLLPFGFSWGLLF